MLWIDGEVLGVHGSGIGYMVRYSGFERKSKLSTKGLQVLGMSEKLRC